MKSLDGHTPPSLKTIIKNLWDKLVEPKPAGDAERRRLSRLLSALLLTIFLLGLLSEAEVLLRLRTYSIMDILASMEIGVILLTYYINRRGYFQPAVFLTIISSAITIFVLFFFIEKQNDSATLLFYFIIPILITEFFLGLREYIVTCAVILAGVFAIQIVEPFARDIFVLLLSLTIILGIANFSRRQLERERQTALREAERKYRTLVEEIPAITYTDRADGSNVTTYISPQVQTILGISQEEWTGSDLNLWVTHIHPDDRRMAIAAYTATQQTGQPLDIDYRMIKSDGQEVWIRDRAIVEKNAGGKPVSIHGVMSDITEIKQSKIALQESQSKLEAFFSQSLDGFFFMMLDEPIRWDDTIDKEKALDYVFEHQRITKINDAVLAQYGVTYEQFIGFTPADFSRHNMEAGRARWRILFDSGHLHVETEERKSDGTKIWVDGDYVCLYDSEGRITGHFGIQREVTEQKRAEEALRESEERYRTLIELSPEVIWINHDNTIVYANRACLDLLGAVSIAQVVGRSPFDIIHPDYHALIEERIRLMLETGEAVPAIEEKLIRLDGTTAEVEIAAAPIRYGDKTAIQVFARDISQRKQAEQAIRASEERFRNIFEFSGIPIWVEDFTGVMDEIDKLKRQGITDFRRYAQEHPEFIPDTASKIKVVDVNNAVLNLFETNDKAKLLGPLSNVYSRQVLANFQEEIFAVAEGKNFYEGETSSVNPRGQRRDEWVTLSIPDTEHLEHVLVTVLDITKRKQHERELEVLARVSAALRHASSRLEMFPVLVDQILSVLDSQGSALILHDPVSKDYIVEATRGVWSELEKEHIPPGSGISGQVFKTGQPYITDNLADDKLVYEKNLIAKGIKHLAAAPLSIPSETIGVLFLGRASAPYTPEEIRVLSSIADMAANAIHRATMNDLALRRAEQLSVVNDIGRTLAETLDLEQIYDQLHRSAFHLLPESATLFISLFDSEKNLITCTYGVQDGEIINPAQLPPINLLPPGEGTQSEVIHTGHPLIIGNLPEKIRNVPGQKAKVGTPGEMTQSALYVPMIAHNSVIGVLQVQSYRPNRYSEGDAELLSVVANAAAAAIENARLFTEVNRRIEQLQALHEIDSAISSSHDLRITLDVLLGYTISQLGVDAAAVLQLNPHTYSLDYSAGVGFRTSHAEIERLPFDEGFAGRVASQRNMLTITNIPAETLNRVFANFIGKEAFTTYIGIPLIAKGLLVGILEIYHRTPLPMNAYWMDFLKTLAGQAALAIDNTELFMRLQESNNQLVMAYDATIEGWSHALDLRDKETEGHTLRVTELTVQLARVMNIPDNQLIHIRRGALLHDIGKMGVPDHILLTPHKHPTDEWQIMRRHPQYAYDLLSPIRYLQQSLDIPFSHHEHWDGNGYPRGLKGELIPPAARIFAIVDVWDAIRSDRPYRPAWSEEKAMEYVKELSGKQFDPRVAEAFLKMMTKEPPPAGP